MTTNHKGGVAVAASPEKEEKGYGREINDQGRGYETAFVSFEW